MCLWEGPGLIKSFLYSHTKLIIFRCQISLITLKVPPSSKSHYHKEASYLTLWATVQVMWPSPPCDRGLEWMWICCWIAFVCRPRGSHLLGTLWPRYDLIDKSVMRWIVDMVVSKSFWLCLQLSHDCRRLWLSRQLGDIYWQVNLEDTQCPKGTYLNQLFKFFVLFFKWCLPNKLYLLTVYT